jgi:hypothetical protein
MNNCDCTKETKNDSGNKSSSSNSVVVDLLFLDLSVCTRCQDTETSLDDSLEGVLELFNNIGREVKLNKIHIETKEQAIKHHFVSSPTIRVNGRDIQMEVKESHCSTCSSLTDGASVDCRVWIYNDKEYSAPPKEMIIDAILSDIYNAQTVNILGVQKEYTLPENLVEYFSKQDKLCANVTTDNSSCCESNDCCS